MSLGGARQRHKKDSEGLDKSGRKKKHPGTEKSTEHWIRNENFPTEKQDNDGKIKYFFHSGWATIWILHSLCVHRGQKYVNQNNEEEAQLEYHEQ